MNQTNDPRIGSGRDNSTGGTLSHVGSSGTNAASLSSLGSTFVPVLVYAVVCLAIFIFLRPRCASVYAPRTISGVLLPSERAEPLPPGLFNWIKPFFKIQERDVLRYCSLDGYFFLRYLRILACICAVGCCCTFPVLFPVHAIGGRHLTQLDRITIGNIADSTRLYAHVAVSWVFFGFILYMVSRECIYYVNLRQACLVSASRAQRLSSRTVMFTSVPQNMLDEARVRKLFGDTVKSVWVPRNTGSLSKLVEERDQTALRLEKAEIDLIKMANGVRQKQIRSGYAAKAASEGGEGVEEEEETKSSSQSEVTETSATLCGPNSDICPSPTHSPAQGKADEEDEYVHPYGLHPSLPDVRGSVAAQWIPAESRPSHRPLANYGRRVDTIRWTRLRLKTLNVQIYKLRRHIRAGHGKPVNALFVEFDSQANAEAAYQIIAHHRPLHMSPAFIGIRPDDVMWSTLRMQWWERVIRRFMVMGVIGAAIIFWSIPAAFVALVSKLSFLTSKVPFLRWLNDLPSVILGVIEGLLPALGLSLLMAAVPWMIRKCAKISGIPSVPLIELYTQNAYFIFQVVQVFLVTTLTAAASSALTSILEDPLSAKDLLSQNLPKASNFYLSYILVQCLAGGAGEFLHLWELIQRRLLAGWITRPRSVLKARQKLGRKHWGSVFPVFTNMGVIAISYSCIAPLILAFAGLGMGFIYLPYKYNLLYSFEADVDTKGVLYPRALMHLIFGVYLAEICLIGLFALHSAFKPLILMVLFFVFTMLVHISINDAVSPLLYGLPRTLTLQDADLAGDNDEPSPPKDDLFPDDVGGVHAAGAASEYYNLEDGIPEAADSSLEVPEPTGDRAIEGAPALLSLAKDWLTNRLQANIRTQLETEEGFVSRMIQKFNLWVTPDRNKDPNFVVRWFHPEIFEDYHILRRVFEDLPPPPDYPEEIARRGYYPPEMWTSIPGLWIPRDTARVSRQEVAHTKGITPISDKGAWLDERGRISVDLDMAPFQEPRVVF